MRITQEYIPHKLQEIQDQYESYLASSTGGLVGSGNWEFSVEWERERGEGIRGREEGSRRDSEWEREGVTERRRVRERG